MRFSAWDETTQQPTLPIDITETNAAGKILESYQLPPTAVTVTNGKPSGVSSGSAKVSWARYTYNSSGSPLHVDRYHVIPASGVGSVGTNFYRTTVIYDTQGRQAATVQFAQTGKWQVDYQIYDWRNRVVEIKRGVAMNPPVLGDLSGATWLKTISKIIYSGERVDKELYYFDTGTNDYTGVKYYYDEWNRVRSAPSFAIINGTETLLAPFTVQDYDWRGNVVDVAQFEVEPNWNTIATNSNFAATATGKFSHNRSSYDIQGRVWKTNVFNNVSNSFDETMYKYNFAGQRISTTHNNTSVESNYDSLGRNIESKMKSGMVVKMIQRQEYDITGNVIGKESLTLNPNETTSINENGTNFVRRTVYNWYDKAGRQMVSADFGSGAVIWTNAAKPARPNIIPENSSEDCLVTKYGFSPTTGQVENATDTKGIITQIFYDTLDRETKKVLNFVDSGTAADENVEVQYVFDGLNNTVTQTVINPTTDNQVTKYLYEDSYDASLQTSAIYPDSSDTNSNGTDQVKNTYHLDGNIKTQTDQNGNVRTFSYDAYRRRIADSVTTVGTGVDGAVRKIAQTYTTQGALEKVSSMDSTNAVLNEVKYEYDANLKLKKLQQSYSNAVTTSTPYLEYSYDSANDNRLTGVVYPSGKVIGYSYDSFDNITSINEGTTPLVSYIYDGSGSPMQTVYNQPNISLTYANGGLDRYGRIINHSWVNNNSALVHIVHGYDYAGNRLYRNDLIQSANSELYTYDNLGQIKTLSRGILNNDQTAITTINHSESWNFDKTGNWLQYINNGTIENRTHNAANELLGIATHDANGNMTLMPGLKGKYDAWNRLVEVRDTSDNLIATYEYNGLNQRIKKTIGSTVTKSFFNEKWQELESQTGAEITSYVWGVRYIDDLVLREKDNERLYSLADPNWNVVSLIDSTGSVVEQLKYDAFGKITWLDNNFSAKNGSDYNWNRTFTGQVIDVETELMLYRNRYYHTGLGRFINRDPIEYDSNRVSLYTYTFNYSLGLTDPFGLESIDVFGIPIDLSGSYSFTSKDIPTPIAGLFINCSISVAVSYGTCCKKCEEFKRLYVSVTGSCEGKYGKAFNMPPDKGKRNEKVKLPCSDEEVKRKKVETKRDPRFNCGGHSGSGGPGSGGESCSKPGCSFIASLFATGRVGTGIGAYFNVSKTLYGEGSFSGLFEGWDMNGGVTTGVYGFSISVGVEFGVNCTFLSATGNECH
jgi:RHS repeat-associated protein